VHYRPEVLVGLVVLGVAVFAASGELAAVHLRPHVFVLAGATALGGVTPDVVLGIPAAHSVKLARWNVGATFPRHVTVAHPRSGPRPVLRRLHDPLRQGDRGQVGLLVH
jgi:uncharacterized membrane protein YeiH